MQMKDAYGRQENLEPQKLLGPIVDQAMDQYCDKYKLGRREKVFKLEDRDEAINKIYGEEMKMIETGAYQMLVRELYEAEKAATLAFGRMNPPTIGHKKLVLKMQL